MTNGGVVRQLPNEGVVIQLTNEGVVRQFTNGGVVRQLTNGRIVRHFNNGVVRHLATIHPDHRKSLSWSLTLQPLAKKALLSAKL